MGKSGLTIIIVNYFSENYVTSLVHSIIATTNLNDYEIIIVSNSPAAFGWDGSYRHQHNISIFENDRNEGFGRAVNRGVGYAKYDYFCTINPDIEILKGTIDELYIFFNGLGSDVGAVSCMIKNSDGTRQSSFFMDKGLQRKRFLFGYLTKLMPSRFLNFWNTDAITNKTIDLSAPLEVGGFYCSFAMIRKSAFLSVGGFDEDFFMYAEDVDFFRTRFTNKYKSIFYPYVELTHLMGKSDKYGLMKHQVQASYLLYLRKAGAFYLLVHVILLSIKYAPMALLSFGQDKTLKRDEALRFFRSLKYLKEIMRYSSMRNSRPAALKIDEIKD